MAEVDRAFTSSAGRSTRNEGWARSAASFCHSLERPAETRSTKRSRRSRKYCASPLILERRTDAAGGTENSDVHNPTRAKDIVERGRDRSGGPSADRGWAQVPMNSNKFTSCSRKRHTGCKSANDPSDVAILSMAVDSQSLFRRSVPRLLPRREMNLVMTYSKPFFRKQIENSPVCCEMYARSLTARRPVTLGVSQPAGF